MRKSWSFFAGATTETPDLEHGEAIRAQGAILRKLQTLLKEKDPGFGGLVQVQNNAVDIVVQDLSELL